MEPTPFTLSRKQLHATGPVLPNTTIILPPSKKNISRIIVGDASGTLIAFRATAKGVDVQFSTTYPDVAFAAVVRGGKRGVGDKVFAGSGTKVVGLSKKGKVFFELETNLTSPVSSLWVEEDVLLTVSGHTLSRFTTDSGSASAESPEELTCLLGLRTRSGVFALAGSYSSSLLLYPPPSPDSPESLSPCSTLRLPSRPTTVIPGLPPTPASYDSVVLVGCSDGSIVAVSLTSIDTSSSSSSSTPLVDPSSSSQSSAQSSSSPLPSLATLWVIPPQPGHQDAIRSLATFDLLHTQTSRQLVAGDGGGNISIYDLPYGPNHTIDWHAPPPSGPILATQMPESIASIVCGVVDASTNNTPSIVVSLFSGMIVGLTPRASSSQSQAALLHTVPLASGGDANSMLSREETEKLINGLEKELVSLRFKAREAHNKYAKHAKTHLPLVRSADARVRVEFELHPRRSCYVLTVESPAVISHILLQADLPLEVSVDHERVSAPILSQTTPGKGTSSRILYTIQPHSSAERSVSVLVRSVEGQAGTLRVYTIVDAVVKSAILERLPIKPLSLHVRIPQIPSTFGSGGNVSPDNTNSNLTTLSLSGSLPLTQIFAWLGMALPSLPERVGDPGEDGLSYAFQSVYLDTYLLVELGPRPSTWGRLTSDNPSTISILREVITREANDRSITLSIDLDLGSSAVSSILAHLEPRMEDALALSRKMALLEGLEELAGSSDPKLDPELAAVVQDADSLRALWKSHATDVDYLIGVLSDLFVDLARFQGVDARSHVPDLVSSLHAGDWHHATSLILQHQSQ